MTEEKEAEQEYGVAVDVESVGVTESDESADATEPVEWVESAEWIESVESVAVTESVEWIESVESVESVEETRAAVLAAWRADRLPGQWPVSADRMACSW
ncbi:hypothetical protein [Streptomyces sp. DSM 15324]|uniref:hypothetical protein n=1 Tax=Streptomyces sp. DSM 15324 TaxID=1739111 RepID=UPI00074A5DE1|nr:hypothetical protein [Streptomyces sp. DSM 15324]KUO08114.1 hypothetical protein AQJ58_32705 [Streptomyces sp. DSM 15324]